MHTAVPSVGRSGQMIFFREDRDGHIPHPVQRKGAVISLQTVKPALLLQPLFVRIQSACSVQFCLKNSVCASFSVRCMVASSGESVSDP